MRFVARLLKWLIVLVVAFVAGLAIWLYVAPPAMIQVAAGYSAKMVCSNVFVAGRDADEVLKVDVQAPGHPILGLISAGVDDAARTVYAELLGVFGGGLAIAREGAGCSSVPDGDVAAAAIPPVPASKAVLPGGTWPDGDTAEPSQDPAIAAILDDAALTGPSMRAVVVVQNGRIVGERYGVGFSAATPLLGWSMTKTVNAAIVGTMIGDGRLSLDRKGLFEAWKGDARAEISLADMMAMSSGLEFNEDYGDVTDVTRMLYLEPDMAAFASAKPLAGEAGRLFSYSSGTAVMLSRIWQDAAGDPAAALAWPRTKLFDPIGMASAVMETDARGTFVGSSYLYANAHDWVRFGQFLLQDGVWKGQQVLPAGFAAWMREPAPASNGEYGRGQLWLHGPSGTTPDGEDPDAGFDLPDDAVWLLGHDGQSMAVIPSKQLVVLRMGLTPSKLGYKSQGLVEALAKALP
ncbi:MAG: serine hydrolase [Mesorhizobium sp.]|nr:serine hydrolase [Mesorhizobium sp.]